MLCYVTRPDAVLMEVEVEAKANGEDCLNQGVLAGPARPRGLTATPGTRARRLPGAGRHCGGGGRGEARPLPSTGMGRAVSCWRAWTGGSGDPSPHHPPKPALSRKKAAPHTCRRYVLDAACR
ncbi:hypothetical protein P7K49_007276 [Saguinus oedipus]|uniref:Uncharacterized protein n=1 Tax=Saguinus oedipus TaxID=9490 RepID=A0ABQ9VV53_SAGOE|nr:hypothetical protein P7K49_007276 [Saguinus oedipus]